MYAVIDAAGRVLACGTAAFVPPAGGQVIETDADPLAGLAAGEEAVWDGAQFQKRQRTISAAEQAFRDDVQTLKTYRTTPKASITAGQTVDAIWALTDMMRRVVAELRD